MAIAMMSGIGITAMRNKLGNEVFTRNRSGQVVRIYVVPVNTITAARSDVRNNWRTCISLWQAVTADEVEQWHIFGQRIMKRNAVAQAYRLGARNAFFMCNQNLLCSGLFPVSAPTFNAMPGIILRAQCNTLTVVSMLLSIKFIANSLVVPDDSVLTVSASPSVSAGINYPRNNFKQIAIYPEFTAADPLNVSADYLAMYGAPTVGQKVFFRISCVQVKSGLRSKYYTFAAIVV